jgi:peroxiredoxin
MPVLRVPVVACLLAGLVFAAEPPAVNRSIDLLEQKAALTSKPMNLDFRLRAAQALGDRYPDLSRKLVDEANREVRSDKDLADDPYIRRSGNTLLLGMMVDSGAAPAPKAAAPRPTPAPELAAIQQRMGQMRGLPTDADRAKLVLQIVADIRTLPSAIVKLGPISSLANLATEGDLGKEALNAVASTLALALKETPGTAANYIELARLVRYEHLTALPSDPPLEAATALLALREQLLAESGFSLTALDGKTYNLDALRGKVVLLNFWATWCPPCRREMPDMEKLFQRFSQKGLVVLAVSDEKRETVEGFLKKEAYTFPVLLDPERKVNTAFGIEGIPNSFLFDRQGKLVAQSIDMRTERQFLEMFRAAGLE